MANDFWTLGASGNWTVAADWSTGIVPGTNDDAVLGVTGFAIVQNYTVSVTTSIDVDSITISDSGAVLSIANPGVVSVATNISNAGEVALQNGGSLAASGDFSNMVGGLIDVDASGPGGSSLKIVGTLTNSGAINVGGTSLTAPSASLTTGGGLDNSASVSVDGGGTLTIGGTLTNSNSVRIGGSDALATLNAQGLDNTSAGVIDINGGSTAAETATLDITDQPATWTGTLSVSGFGLLEFSGTSQIGAIASDGAITLSGPHAFVADAGLGLGDDTALTGLASNAGNLALSNGASLTTGGAFDNSGKVLVDDGGTGGSTLTIGGTLTNSGDVQIGDLNLAGTLNAQGLDNTDTGTINIDGGSTAAETATLDITVEPATWTGSLSVSGYGRLEFSGSSQIGAIASGGVISLSGPNAFVADIALGVGGDTALTGLAGNAGTLALTEGASLTTGGGFDNSGSVSVDRGSTLTLGGTLTNSNSVQVGGSNAPATLNAQGLDNTGAGVISIDGGSTAAETATLDITAQSAPAAWTGTLSVSGYGLLDFSGSSQIGAIASGGVISLSGPNAFVADAELGVGDDTALARLASNAGQLNLSNGASLTTGVGFENSGFLDNINVYTGATLTIGGTLSNSGDNTGVNIGGYNASATLNAQGLDNTGSIKIEGGSTAAATATLDITGQSAPATWTGALSVSGYGLVEFSGSSQIGAIASGGGISLSGPDAFVADAGLGVGDDTALTGLASNAGQLDLSNGASLTTSGGFVNSGFLDNISLDTGATLTIGGTLTNSGGNSGVNIGGANAPATLNAQGLVNTGSIQIKGGSTAAATATLDITGQSAPATWTGALSVSGYGLVEFSGTSQIEAIASGGGISLSGPDAFVADAGLGVGDDTALTGLASNAGQLDLSNGASLTTSGGFVNSGFLDNISLDTGATLTIGGTLTNIGGNSGVNIGGANAPATLNAQGLVNTGTIEIYGSSESPPDLNITGAATNSDAITISANSDMSVGGAFTDSGAIALAGTLDLGGGLTVTATGSVAFNNGVIITPDAATLTVDAGGGVSGDGAVSIAVANDGTVTASGGLLDVAGPITGAGELAIASASELELGGATSETAAFGGDVGTLKLDQPQSFTGAITGLVKGDTIDLAGVQATNAVVAGSTLTVTAGSQTFSYQVSGSGLSGNNFALEDDQQGGTDLALGPPGPTISGPTTQTAFLGWPSVLGPLTIADPNVGNGSLTVTITAGSGLLFGFAANASTLSGSDGNKLVLTGDLVDINTMLASVLYLGPSAGATDKVLVDVTDASNATSERTIDVSTNTVPFTSALVDAPALDVGIVGTFTALGGVSVSDPYAQATDQPLNYFLVNVPGVSATTSSGGTYTASGGSAAVVTGQGTGLLQIQGTVGQINSYLSDAAEGEYSSALAEANAMIDNLTPSAAEIKDLTVAINRIREIESEFELIADGTEGELAKQALVADLRQQVLVIRTIGNGSGVFQLGGQTTALFLDPVISIYNILAQDPPEHQGTGGTAAGPAIHIEAASGTLYQFDAVGEFVFAQSTLSGDSFQVQVRLQPYNDSSSASAITQIATLIGGDRVTFAIGRAETVWVDGTPSSVGPANPVALSGGKITQTGPDTYEVAWDTGETLTVVNDGTYLDLSVGLGANDGPGSVVGLVGPDEGQANDFMLPDGTVLQQPLSTAELYQTFANAWRVTQATSLFDYAAGQSTATFTNTNFADPSITLADLPANLVTQAAQAVAATGITDAGAVAAMEFDYIASGGDPTVLANDASAYQGVTTTPATVTESEPAPTVLGVIAPVSAVQQAQSGPTAVAFDVYLTAPETTDTIVDYSVEDPNADDFNAAAFGGTLPAGSITIAAGQTTGTITIDVPQGALGALSSEDVALQISTPDSVPIFAPASVEAVTQATVTAPTPLNTAVAQLEYLGSVGTFSQSGDNYTLDIGEIQFGAPLPALQFSIANAATSSGDALSGTFAWPTVAGFDVNVDGATTSGASLTSPIAAGSSDQALTVTTVQDKFGAQDEVITFNPVDTNASGYSSALTPITLTIADTLEVPGMIYSQAFGDVHIITYNGLEYDFQAFGEFTLAKSNIAGNSFDIQLRLQPYLSSSSVTLITQVAASLGAADVTFSAAGLGQPVMVLVNGQATSLSMADPTLTLAGGSITEVSPTLFKVAWNTGESMTVTETTFHEPFPYLDVTDAVPYATYGEVSGLQGENEGTENDFQLPDGTVLQQPLTSAQLYGEYANAWRVGAANSLMYYAPGQSYGTFDVPNFPSDPITLADLPANVVAQAVALVTAAGITDPVTAAAAELDYIATGDPSFIASAANVNQQVTGTVAPIIKPSTTPSAAVGVEAVATKVTEAAAGSTAVTFNAYLAVPAGVTPPAVATTVDYTAELGGAALPSGSVVIAANQTTAQITVDVPQGALGTSPDENLQVQVSSPGIAVPIFAPTAETEIVNDQAEPGSLAVPELAYLGTIGTFSFDSATNTYTLNLGGETQGASIDAAEFAVVNAATGSSDNLAGTFTAPTGTGFIITGDNLPTPLGAGEVYQGLYASVNTAELGANGMALTFNPEDVNDSGYSAALTPLTLKIVDSVVAAAAPTINTPTTIIFPNVHVGATDSQHVSVANSAPAGAADLDVTLTASGQATASGTITNLAPGATDASDLSVGIDTSTAGALSGSVTENFVSDAGGGNTMPLASEDPYIDVFGTAYRLADPSIVPGNLTVHVGDSGTQSIEITNIDPNDGYSENLIATVVGTTGTVTASGTTGDIAPQQDSSIAVDFSTATPGAIGTVTLDLKSDGTGIDGLGTTDLGDFNVPVTATSTNVPAAAQFEEISGGGTFTQNGAAYNLDLGTITAPTTVSLGVLNSAAAPADTLSGSFTTSGPSEFVLSGFDAFSGVAAGQADTAPTVTLDTGFAGTFTETITLQPVGAGSGGNTPLPPETLTITGTIATPTPPPVITAPSTAQVQAGQASPVTGVSIADANSGVSIAVGLSDNAGLLSANASAIGGGGTIVGAGSTSLTITGTLAQVNADLLSLSDTDATSSPDDIIVSASDSDGGVATPAFVTVTVAPTVTIAPVDSDNVINYAEANAAAGVALSGTVTGLAAGATFAVAVADGGFSKSYTATVNAAGTGWTATIPEADAITLPNGTATLMTQVTDADGNVSTQASDSVTVAETLPTVTIAPVDGDNVINYAEANAAAGVALSGTVTGLAAGATFSAAVADGNFSKSYTATVVAAGTGWTATIPEADAITLPNGTATVTTQVTDAYGNVSTQAGDSVTVAETLPPVLGGAGNAVFWTQGNSPTVVDNALAVTDAGSATLTGATVTISSGFLAGDQLNFANQNGITGSYKASTGVLTLTGVSSVANYQKALELGQLQLDQHEPERGWRRQRPHHHLAGGERFGNLEHGDQHHRCRSDLPADHRHRYDPRRGRQRHHHRHQQHAQPGRRDRRRGRRQRARAARSGHIQPHVADGAKQRPDDHGAGGPGGLQRRRQYVCGAEPDRRAARGARRDCKRERRSDLQSGEPEAGDDHDRRGGQQRHD